MTSRPEPFGRLSFVIPMWNEEAYARAAYDAVRHAAEHLIDAGDITDWELVVVDDASTDATPQILDEIAAGDPHVDVVHHPVNRTLGGSVKSGLSKASGDVVLYVDADLPCDLFETARAFRVMRSYDADIVAGYRHHRTGEGPRRAVYSFAYNTIVQRAFGLRMIRDVNFAYKLIRRRVLDRIEIHSEGSFIDAEILIRANDAGFRIVQIALDYFPRTRGVSTLSSLAVIGRITREMGRFAVDRNRTMRRGTVR
ncbi:MAG TPA: glycosyltransferase family 2 protein [Acidimicrobiales bacterium]|nr:glycosyltransferase family 2 protein [Acidimicrobiales bacterium]